MNSRALHLIRLPGGRRKRGRPRETWHRTTERRGGGEMKERGLKSWIDAAIVVTITNMMTWKREVSSLTLH